MLVGVAHQRAEVQGAAGLDGDLAVQAGHPPLVLVLEVRGVGPLHDREPQRVVATGPDPAREVELGRQVLAVYLENRFLPHKVRVFIDYLLAQVRRELATPLEPLKATVQEALALLVEDGKPATLRLHPDDLALLQAEPTTPWAGVAVQLQADDSLTPGGCVVESPQGAVDATVEKRWARAVANLGLQAPWKPGELADV